MIKITENEAKMIKWLEELNNINGDGWVSISSLSFDKKSLNGLIKKELVAVKSDKFVTRKFYRAFNPNNYEIIC